MEQKNKRITISEKQLFKFITTGCIPLPYSAEFRGKFLYCLSILSISRLKAITKKFKYLVFIKKQKFQFRRFRFLLQNRWHCDK